jgi:HD superfamily phosphohydrolase
MTSRNWQLDVERTIRSYASEGEGELQRILTLLERHTLPWRTGIGSTGADAFPLPDHYRPVQELTTTTTFPDQLDHIYSVPFLYRLAFLKQLSLVAVTSHFDAQHTRLSHAIGAARIAHRMLSAIRAHSTDPDVLKTLDGMGSKACVFYAFIHDAFHGPMGHTLDIMKDVFEIGFTMKLDEHYLKQGLEAATRDADDPIGHQLRTAAQGCSTAPPENLLNFVGILLNTTKLDTQYRKYWFLRDIVDSQLDCDRLDYIARDTRYLHGREAPDARVGDLIDSARALPVPGNGKETETRIQLAYHERYESTIVELLRARRELYSNYYEATEKLIADDMLCHAVYYILRDKGVTGFAGDRDHTIQRQVIRQLLLLTDDDFFSVLNEFRGKPASDFLLLRLRQHRYFKKVYQRGIAIKDRQRARTKTNAWRDVINQYEADARLRPNERAEIIKLVASASEPFVAEETNLIVGVQRWGIRGFLDRHELEKQIWAVLAVLDRDGDAQRKYLLEEYGRLDFMPLEEIAAYPPVHLTTTSYFDERDFNRESAESEYVEGFSEWTKENSRPQMVYLYNDAGAVRERRVPIDENPLLEFYPLVLSAPDSLLSAFAGAQWRDTWPAKEQLEPAQSARGLNGTSALDGVDESAVLELLHSIDETTDGQEVIMRATMHVLRSCNWLWPPLAAGHVSRA